ncbi:MAG: 4Fe-4S binding protein [Eubacteriales bacterium]
MKKNSKELKILKIILWVYIVLCIIIAGLNYGYARNASDDVAKFITWGWHFYENWVKTIFIIVGSYLTLKILKDKNTTMRKKNLIGFISAALVVHIIGPIILGNSELYFFTMPLPWTTTPLQLLSSESSFYMSRFPIWGLNGITMALIFFVIYSLVVLVGTLFLGRRWQCSTICLFNGFASEVFDQAIPLIGKRKKVKDKTVKILFAFKWIFFAVAVFFTLYWVLLILGLQVPGEPKTLGMMENYKYLSSELLMAMFFWVAFIGRGYCYYCPLGTLLGFIARAADQKITTDNTKCISCGKCDDICPMSIRIKEKAEVGEAVVDSNCVGCGRCVDNCPTKTLSYSTKFLNRRV